jgi:tetratricopeptide (TPR) repeat protein
MRRWMKIWAIFFALLVCAGAAAAQGNNEVDGQVLDAQGKPMPDATVTLKSEDTGEVKTLKSDKNGKFVQLGLKAGIYDVSITTTDPQIPQYNEKLQLKDGQSGTLVVNFKEILASPAYAEETKKRAADADAFKNMKANFDAGVASMTDAGTLLTQLRTAPADQKAALQDKRKSDCDAAINSFEQAEKGVGAKDTKNHSLVWSNLGAAYECGGRYDDAASAFQKAIDLNPTPAEYRGLSTNLANAAAALTDPAAIQQKVADASASCDKAIAIDPTVAAPCWKNIGIALYNKQRQKEATEPLQKAAAADPKDAQTWFLLGSCLSAQIQPKEENGKETYVIPPGTTDAYQKCMDTAPNTPYAGYAAQCKESLSELAVYSGGVDTSAGKKKH